MNLKSLRMLLGIGLIAVAGHVWATVAPSHTNDTWQDISSITWSTDGTNWGNSASLVVGQSVEFKVAMHKTNIGNHYADFVKVWIDWNGDAALDNTSEVLLADYRVANASYRDWNLPERLDGGTYEFRSSSFVVTNAMIGTHDLLARVTCSDSLLGNWGEQWKTAYTQDEAAWYKNNFLPTGNLYQGELNRGTLTVTAANTVPEPGTLALLAVAMLGMGLRRKLANRHD
ncbi:MAG: hypothetical protein CVU34_09605 [Betaproteobacteria bacterium HGW-Betaproteobacteria-7]|jgi:hypothetical protein|nr:MAG: hypothetical protein CVU34_09605 [Betaproteobacteria bacterium HGW-Betaproteobacteria-7]